MATGGVGGLPGTLEPLCFQLSPQNASLLVDDPVLSTSCVPCIICNETFSGELQISDHLLANHKIIVKDLPNITDLSRYMKYWKDRVNDGLQLNEFCLIVRTNSPDKQDFQFILSDELAEDRELRTRIKTEKLEEILIQQQKERFDDSFSRNCLFCTKIFTGNRAKLFAHMAQFHNFDLGDVNNLVYTTQLLSLLEQKLHNLQCLYCEKTFKDGPVLKEHMRKKRHKRLRSSNPVYRCFYVTGYLGRNVADTDDLDESNNDEDSEEDYHDEDDEDDLTSEQSALQNEHEWNDWVEKTEEFDAVCLFCHHTSADTEPLLLHLKAVHRFDLLGLITAHKLTFYQQVKLINFMRRQFHYNVCTLCDEKFENYEALAKHLTDTSHSSQLPPATSWNQPQYYFPTYENDSLLCSLVDIETEDEVASEMLQVIAEDLPECVNNLTLQTNEARRPDLNYVN